MKICLNGKKTHSPNCIYCTNVMHSDKHLLWDCPETKELWQSIGNILDIVMTWETVVIG
jgi:lipopolysaccharide biosynthesis regulator YciM